MNKPSDTYSSENRGKKRRAGIGPGLWVLVLAALFTGLIYLAASKTDLSGLLTWTKLWSKIVKPIIRTTIFISFGLFVGQIMESTGWTVRIGRLVRPIIGWSHLPAEAGAAFTSAFISGVLSNTLLYTSWQEGRLSKRGLVLGNLLCNSLPMFVLHLPTTLFIALSLTKTAGLFYMLLMFSSAVFRFVGVTLASRLMMPTCEVCLQEQPAEKRPWMEVWADTWPKFTKRIKRLIIVIVPVYIAVVVLAESGFFDWLRTSTADWAVSQFMPMEAMSLVIFSLVAEFTSGFAAAGALMESAALTIKEAALALVIGNVISTPVRALRHQLPQYMGIFTPAFGLRIMLISQIVRVASVLFAALLFFLLYPS